MRGEQFGNCKTDSRASARNGNDLVLEVTMPMCWLVVYCSGDVWEAAGVSARKMKAISVGEVGPLHQ